MNRIYSIDFTRGLVIIIMALDHIRDLMHTTSLTQDPTDLATTTPALFMTRWITHLCAPIFVFLAGTSVYLVLKKQQNITETRNFLLTRGLWLILLELSIISFGIWFDVYFRTFLLQVIYTIGAGFIILSLMLKLSPRTIGGIGLTIILLHNAIPVLNIEDFTGRFFWALFFSPNFFQFSSQVSVIVMYPVIPWLGIMLFGFATGQLFELSDKKRPNVFFLISLSLLLVFIVLRTFNLYGDPALWAPQKNTTYSIMSFMNVTKYPPSLLFTSVTLGIMFLVLALTDKLNNSFIRFFVNYGRVPLFFYILHWYVVHIFMFVMVFLQGATWNDLQFGGFNFGRPATGVGLELPFIYLVWLAIICLFYPLCQWYGQYKAAHRDKKWLSYL